MRRYYTRQKRLIAIVYPGAVLVAALVFWSAIPGLVISLCMLMIVILENYRHWEIYRWEHMEHLALSNKEEQES